MSIDCCKSFVGKQIIGLLPSGTGKPPENLCIYYSNFNYGTGFGGLNFNIDNTYYPYAPNIYEIGTSIQTDYQTQTGGFSLTGTGLNLYAWTVENSLPLNWQFQDELGLFQPMFFSELTCDLRTVCYEVDIPQSGAAITQFLLNGDVPFNAMDVGQYAGLSTNDPFFPIMLQSVFGGQATITVIDNGTSTYIKVENCFFAIRPKAIEVNFVYYPFTECSS